MSAVEETVELEWLIAEVSAMLLELPADALDDRLEEAMQRIADFAGADRITVAERAPAGDVFRRAHEWVREGLPRSDGMESLDARPWARKRLVRCREPLVFSSLAELPAEAMGDRQSFERHGVRSMASFPLVVGGSVIGALTLSWLRSERPWSAKLIERLRCLSDIVASTLARRRIHVELREALAFERVIAELSAALINLPPEAVDEHVIDGLGHVAEFLDLDGSVVAQRALDPHSLAVTHSWVRRPEWKLPSIIPGEALPWLVAQVFAGNSVSYTRIDELPPEAELEREFARRHGPKSFTGVPLIVGGEIIGVLIFGTLGSERTWSAGLLERFRLIAEIIANALARKRSDVKLRAALTENEGLRQRLEAENIYLQAEVKSANDFDEIVGRSPAIRAMLHKVEQVAATDAPVLLLGQTGTGKELIAHAIHARSGRRQRPLIAVNCAALPPSLIESELFGHEKGAFTGAMQTRAGRFELADGSTLFLDEIGDLDPPLQAKLLRALQGGEIQRVGSSRSQKVNVRIITATNRDLEAAMRDGRFREDLYYRLDVFPIEVPPLRARREDIPLLVWHFIQSRQRDLGRLIKQIPQAAMDALVAYDWPGNVRELQNVIDRALILSTGPTLRIEEAFGMGPAPRSGRGGAAVENLRDAERAHIVSILERCTWTIEGRGQAAERLGLRPSTLRNRMRKLTIRRPAARS